MTPTQLTLRRSILPRKANPPLESYAGAVTYMGQILKQLNQNTFRNKGRLAYTLNQVHGLENIPPFTLICCNIVTQSDLATQIINTPFTNEYRLEQLLTAHNIKLTIED